MSAATCTRHPHYLLASCPTCRESQRRQARVHTEHVDIPRRPSQSFIETMRATGASEATIGRALGEPQPKWWQQ